MEEILIIAIGNVARGDDGVAHEVAAGLLGIEPALPDGVRVLTAVGLDIAMAQDVAGCSRLLVVDAQRRDAPLVDVQPIIAGVAAHSGHAIDAPALLAVTLALYGVSPTAALVSVAAPEMGHGEGLSATALKAATEAVAVIRSVVAGG